MVKLRGPDEMLFYKDGDNTALTSGTRHALKPAHSFYAKWTKYENTLSHAHKIFLLHDMLRHWVLYYSSNTCLRFLI